MEEEEGGGEEEEEEVEEEEDEEEECDMICGQGEKKKWLSKIEGHKVGGNSWESNAIQWKQEGNPRKQKKTTQGYCGRRDKPERMNRRKMKKKKK